VASLPKRTTTGPFAWITLAVVIVIIYLSLFPFSFQSRPGSPTQTLAATYGVRDSRADILANILLYLPFGFFAMQSLRRRTAIWQVAAVTFAGMVLSTAMELLQFYVPGRDSSLADIGSNTLGSLLGAGAGVLLSGRLGLGALQPVRGHLSSALIVICWLGYRLFPYVPDTDLHKYWHAVRPLLVAPVLEPLSLYRHTVIWLVLALALDELCVGLWKRLAFPLLVPLLLGSRILIVDIVLSPAEVLGAVIALIFWFAFLARLPVRNGLIFSLFVILVIVQALEPFRFTATARPFTWVPFRGFIYGSLVLNVQSFLEKTFLYGSLVWLAMRAGISWRKALLACGALVFGLRLLQVYIPDRSAEISDVIILLVVGGVIGLLDRESSATAAESVNR
jgi:VanZ family protein